MTQPPENDPNMAPTAGDDPNSWLDRVKRLFERSVLSCSMIIDFNKALIASEQLSADEQTRFKMLPTEMIVAMHNLRVGIEDALMGLAIIGLPTELKTKAKDLFIENQVEDVSTDLKLLFKRVIEDGGPEGFLPIAKIMVPAASGVSIEQYLGTLDFLKEMAAKYQQYDFENVPKAMEGACRKGDTIADPFTKTVDKNTCSHLEKPEDESNTGFDPKEAKKYQKMCEELTEDAHLIYGQFCAVGSIYRAAIQK